MKPGRDLDKLIAEKVMGFTVSGTNCTDHHGSFELPFYSSFLGTSLWVIEKIKSRNSIVVIHFTDSNEENGEYACEIFDKERNLKRGFGKHKVFYSSGETLAHAICLCALREENFTI